MFVPAVLGCMILAPSPIVRQDWVFESAPFAQCHASTIEQTRSGMVCAWFGGSAEGNPDVGIWVARVDHKKWTIPIEVARGRDENGKSQPCWNPVLFRPVRGPLMLFYKVGPNPREWWGMLKTSTDQGKTWSPPRRLPEGILGPVKNRPIQLANGEILCPSSEEGDGWRVHFEWTSNFGKSFKRTQDINDGKSIEAIQPSILRIGKDELLAIGRTKQDRVFETASKDGGRSWSPLVLGELPNPNSGIDATTLLDGRHLVVYNHVQGIPGQWRGERSPLNIAVSSDGLHWKPALVLENEPGAEFSYPSVVQARDGLVHIVYTWKRIRLRHVVIDPKKLVLGAFVKGNWPK